MKNLLWIVIAVVVIGGGAYWFTHQGGTSGGSWSSNMCDYFTPAIASANLSTPVVADQGASAMSSTICAYGTQSNPGDDVALFDLVYKGQSPSTISEVASSMASHSTSVSGVGDEAFYISSQSSVLLYFTKGGNLASLMVKEPNGNVQQDLSEAENIAKAILPSMPN